MEHFSKLFLNYIPGTVFTTEMLKAIKILPQLAQYYVKRGWLISIGNGAYARKNDSVSWIGALATLQSFGVEVYVGAAQALNLLGMNQNVFLGKPFVHLFTPPEIQLPKWFLTYDFGVNFYVNRTDKYNKKNLVLFENSGFNIRISRTEQAILEVCRFVPKLYSFENLQNYIESLPSLNPLVMQSMLEESRNIKEKRLFLYMASSVGHAWCKKLNFEKINLGNGPRQVIQNGSYNRDFHIMVSKGF